MPTEEIKEYMLQSDSIDDWNSRRETVKTQIKRDLNFRFGTGEFPDAESEKTYNKLMYYVDSSGLIMKTKIPKPTRYAKQEHGY